MRSRSSSYVLVFCCRTIPAGPSVLVIHKDHPEWQAGRINLPGGRIEEGETPEQTAIRELQEETGLIATKTDVIGQISDGTFTIHVVKANLEDYWQELKPREGETEKPEWVLLSELIKDSRVLPNLHVIIPLAMCDVRDWSINDIYDGRNVKDHTIVVTVKARFE